MTERRRTFAHALACVTLAWGCHGAIEGGPGGGAPFDPDPDPSVVDPHAPSRESVGSAQLEGARQLRRLTADQLHRSLEVATGERWADYERYAGALGAPDLAEVTDEGLSPSVAFAKLVDDAARATCGAAVDADLRREPAARVILRHASAEDDGHAAIVENLRYLLLRFHAVSVDADDERLTPWLGLLSAAPREGELDAAGRALRWKAVCVGLVTHPHFLTY
ncbi:MAG: hypothetical protein KF901_27010 [Myxococcales bacterium]|nr:hypothetical protein [Myxococcales bacterium]